MRFYIYQLLQIYDRIMWVDSDVIFTSKCQNVFQLVDESQMGVVADMTAQKIFQNNEMFLQLFTTEYKKKYPIKKHQIKPYFNSGVLIVSKEHRELFNIDIVKQITDKRNCPDQDHLNWMSSHFQYKMHYLPKQYNMSINLQDQYDFQNAKIIHCNRINKNTPPNKMMDVIKYIKKFGIK